MKTAEEKAEEYADKEIPIAYTDEMQTIPLTELRQAAKIDYLAGYNEAMRWRDFDKDIPDEGQHIIRKIEPIDENDIFFKRNPYYADVYNRAHADFDSEEYKKARERFRYLWRPIE